MATTSPGPPAPGADSATPAQLAGTPPRRGDIPAVATSGLTRDYGGTGLFDVDLRVPAGCVYGLAGPNGAGKTTLLSIITGMRHADRGTVEVAVPRRQVAVCPDVPEFDGWLTAFEVVDLARSFTARPDGAAVLAALRTAGLDHVTSPGWGSRCSDQGHTATAARTPAGACGPGRCRSLGGHLGRSAA